MSCIFCNSDVINTQMTITIDGDKVSVDLCEEHAEDATVKTVREAYIAKQQEIDMFLKRAAELGLQFQAPTGSNKIITATKTQPEPEPQQQSQPDVSEIEDADDVIPTTKIDNHKGMVSVGGSTEFGHIPSHSSIDVKNLADKLPNQARDGKAKMAIMEGREGHPLIVQQQRTDGTGTTRINIVKKEDDSRLQRRFKTMAAETMREDGYGNIAGITPNFAREGYSNSMTKCPICRGDCVINDGNKKIDCPKCEGVGMISIF